VLRFEKKAWEEKYIHVVGVDEAGRGPLAGPVTAAAVYIEPDFLLCEEYEAFALLNDSKQLTEKRREHFFSFLTQSVHVHYGVACVSEKEIDRINILRATHKAMAEAIRKVNPVADYALVDGRAVPGLPCPSQSIIKGDTKSLSIAAASVLAKVTRDHLLVELDQKYPQYGFTRHKGYGTKAHLEALQKYGPAPCHRMSFRPVREAASPMLDFG